MLTLLVRSKVLGTSELDIVYLLSLDEKVYEILTAYLLKTTQIRSSELIVDIAALGFLDAITGAAAVLEPKVSWKSEGVRPSANYSQCTWQTWFVFSNWADVF